VPPMMPSGCIAPQAHLTISYRCQDPPRIECVYMCTTFYNRPTGPSSPRQYSTSSLNCICTLSQH
jgi:hypothetical protein